jgi:hypothetical protein
LPLFSVVKDANPATRIGDISCLWTGNCYFREEDGMNYRENSWENTKLSFGGAFMKKRSILVQQEEKESSYRNRIGLYCKRLTIGELRNTNVRQFVHENCVDAGALTAARRRCDFSVNSAEIHRKFKLAGAYTGYKCALRMLCRHGSNSPHNFEPVAV